MCWDSCHVQWPCRSVPLVSALQVGRFLLRRKFTLSDHLFSNYVPVPASRKLSALVMWTHSWVCNQGQCLMLRTFSYPLKDEGWVNYYLAELIGFFRGWFRLWWRRGSTHGETFLSSLSERLEPSCRAENEWVKTQRQHKPDLNKAVDLCMKHAFTYVPLLLNHFFTFFTPAFDIWPV